jgi:NAD(P)-dependent dehydrogenase (short-subunit alcohol dehydrogenase family)
VRGDVSRPGDCDAAVAETLDRYGRLDVLVNNAGRQLDPLRRVEEMPMPNGARSWTWRSTASST